MCVSIETNCHHHRYRQTGIDLKNEIKFSYLQMFLFERRDDSFFFSLSGKTQVNIYLLSLLILNSMYVTRSRQSEGRRSLNTSILIISLAK